MSHISAEDRARAAETKRRRTRERLIHAADRVLERDGLNATVEAICTEAGVSAATFYGSFGTREYLCMTAFTELVIANLERGVIPEDTVEDRIDQLSILVEGRRYLLVAALMGRLMNVGTPRPGLPPDFVESLAIFLWPSMVAPPGPGSPVYRIMHALALEALDALARGQALDDVVEGLIWVIEQYLLR